MKRNSDITVRFQVLKMRTCFLSLTAIELSISTIYPKSQFCTIRHKRLCFQGFSGISEPFTGKAKNGNCKFEPQKCNSMFKVNRIISFRHSIRWLLFELPWSALYFTKNKLCSSQLNPTYQKCSIIINITSMLF